MKFFFCASIQGKPQFDKQYRLIEEEGKRLGYDIDASTVFKYTSEQMHSWSDKEVIAFHHEVTNGMKSADALIIEASYPSLGVGFNLATAIQLGKPVIIFYSGETEPHLFRTLEKTNDKVQLVRYLNIEQLRKELPIALCCAIDNQDTRFNFFISSEHAKYLDWIAHTYKISRSVYLRKLINQEMDTLAEEFSLSSLQ